MTNSISERFLADNKRLLIRELRRQTLIGDDAKLAERFAGLCQLHEYEEGDILIKEAAQTNDIILLLTGEVSVRVFGRQRARRIQGQHVGEMALVDPTKVRSASVVATTSVLAARIGEHDFEQVALDNPELWRKIAVELADRLRQRSRFVRPVNEIPALFVGCSVEGLQIARTVESALEHDPIDVTVWETDVFEPSHFTIQDLEGMLLGSDFAALIFTPDDKVTSREEEKASPRDNVVFELGLFMGALGHERTFVIQPRGVDLKIPTDLVGLTPLTYKPGADDRLPNSLAPVCHKLRKAIRDLGCR